MVGIKTYAQISFQATMDTPNICIWYAWHTLMLVPDSLVTVKTVKINPGMAHTYTVYITMNRNAFWAEICMNIWIVGVRWTWWSRGDSSSRSCQQLYFLSNSYESHLIHECVSPQVCFSRSTVPRGVQSAVSQELFLTSRRFLTQLINTVSQTFCVEKLALRWTRIRWSTVPELSWACVWSGPPDPKLDNEQANADMVHAPTQK